jgi:hypothetical protein
LSFTEKAMRELIKAAFRFSWASSLFGVRQLATSLSGGLADPDPDLAPAFQKVAGAAAATLEGSLSELHNSGVRLQSGIIDAVLPSSSNGGPSAPGASVPGAEPLVLADSGRLNTTAFIVLGEGLAAGMGDFSMSAGGQSTSFPAQMSRQMGRAFVQTLIEAPGIGDAFGFAELPVVVPSPLQTSVLDQIPPQLPANLSVPGLTISDAIHLRPRQPLVDRQSSKQTAVNFILGIRGIAYGTQGPLPTQLESATGRKPTFAVVELGYAEAIEAAVAGDPGRLPSMVSFKDNMSRILKDLRAAGAEVLLLTIPDPTDTAHFSTLPRAAVVAKLEPELLSELWHLKQDDLITANGLNEIGFQIFGAAIGPLPSGSVLPAVVAGQIQSHIRQLNQEMRQIANAEGAHVCDLHAFWKRLRTEGLNVGARKLTADYLGGFYSLNGYYPGATGQALIANQILSQLNQEFGAKFAAIDIASVMATDPIAAYKPAPGPNWTRENLPAPTRAPSAVSTSPAFLPPPLNGVKCLPLTLPPGLEQVLPLNPALSYFGDAIAALNERTPQTIAYGSGGSLIFGGMAMVDSHLKGNVRLKFSPPVNGCAKFQMSFEGLTGDDEVLAAPRFFKMAFRQNSVSDIPGFVSSGTLNLNTGEVDLSKGALNIFALYSSTALNALVSVNPTFPLPPKAPLSFPGPYGTACLVFDQRPDGKLDITFNGATYVPLGKDIVWPLNFTGPAMKFATIPAAGTVIHPHLAFSTKQAPPCREPVRCPEVPVNTLQEYTLFAPISSFGDVFTLNAPQFGGPATGRSRLLGRVQIQFGPRCGNSLPVMVSTTTAGGTLAPMEPTPIAQLFPARLTPGPLGFYENLRFPLRTYSLNDLAIIDDPFDISVGLLDLSSGHLRHPLLHRGFINQDLIFALIRVEPCTPQNSFLFRGAADFQRGPDGKAQFNYYGQVHIPYPPGFLFPEPNLATGTAIGPDSALDPYLWFWAFQDENPPDLIKTGGSELLSSKGERFSYRYSIPGRPDHGPAEFQYENFTQQGKFRMHSLAWVGFGNSNTDPSGDEFDTISFTGFGVWSKGGLEQVEQVSVQISTSSKAKYVGIQIGLGDVSNVNTPMPPDAFPVRPAEPGGFLCALGMPSTPPLPPQPPHPCPPGPPPCGAAM